MSQRARQRNNTIAGSFVLLSIVGFLAVVVTLSDMSGWGGTRQVTVRFDTATGTPGLERGAAVTLAGVPIGRVKSVALHLDPQPNGEDYVNVVLTIPNDYIVRRDAEVGLVVPIIGSDASINFEGFGASDPLTDDDVLYGNFAPSTFLRSAGLGPEQMEQLRTVIDRLAVISTDVAAVTTFSREAIEEDGERIVAQVREMAEWLNGIVASMRNRWPEWETSIDRSLANVEHATEEADLLLGEGRDLVASIDEGVTGIRETFDEVSPSLKKTAENIETITTKAREEWIIRIDSITANADESMERVVSVLTRLDDSLTTDLPEVSRILANMRLASNNLKLAMIEIRNEPWRLLAAPSERAIEEALMYDAVRTYANAVSDLDASILSLQALHERYGDEFDPESDVVQQVLAEIQENLKQYKSAEKLWYDMLIEQSGGQN